MNKALIIDVKNQLVREATTNDYKDIYDLIGNGCTTFACPIEFDNGDALYVDDEGLYHDNQGCFIMEGWSYPIVGNAVILGCDEEGESVDCKSTIEEISSKLKFYSKDVADRWSEISLNSPRIIITN